MGNAEEEPPDEEDEEEEEESFRDRKKELVLNLRSKIIRVAFPVLLLLSWLLLYRGAVAVVARNLRLCVW